MNGLRPAPHQLPADPMGYVFRRLSSLVAVAGAAFGIAVLGILEEVGLPILFAAVVGFVLFVAVANFAISLAARDPA